MFEIYIEYKDANKYFHDVKYLKTTDTQMHLFCDHGMTILLDLINVENISIFRMVNGEDKKNEHIN